MPVYDLPPLQFQGIPAPRQFGRWEDVVDLAGLAGSLLVAGERTRARDVKGIPDAWAHIKHFGQLLTDIGQATALRTEAIGQWRGLLALFALQSFYATAYELEVVPVRLSDHHKGRPRLRRVLDDLQPTASALRGVDWNAIGIVLFRNRSRQNAEPIPIAILSPEVLLAAGKDAAALAHEHVPWLKAGLSDPLSAGGLSADHLLTLVQYVAGLIREITLAAAGGDGSELQLLGVLRAFSNEASRQLEEASRLVEPSELTPYALPLRWPSLDVYRPLGETWRLEPSKIPAGASRASLDIRPEMARLFQGVILLDHNLQNTFGVPAEAIRLWEGYSLRDAESPSVARRIKDEATAKGFLVIEPGDIFTEKLVLFKGGATIPGHPASCSSALLPISPLALMLMRSDRLAASIAISDQGGGHQVQLALDLKQGERGQPSQHVLVKFYSSDDVHGEEDRPDDLSLWPNFQAQDWAWTFLHYQFDPEFELQPRFGITAEFIAADIAAQSTANADKVRLMAEWSSAAATLPDKRLFAGRISEIKDAKGRTILHRLRFAETSRLVGELQRLPLGAEAIYFARREAGEGTERPVGCALIRPAQPTQGQGDAQVSVDFGTTNTIAYAKRGAELKAVSFADRLLFPIRPSEHESEQRERLVEAYTDFFPLASHETPIPTVSKRRDFRGDQPAALRSSLKGGHDAQGFTDSIFFVPGYEGSGFVGRVRRWIAEDQLVFGIKWARDEASRRLTKRFLRQVMMMTAAELLAGGVPPENVRWRFSYPQAFSSQDLVGFQSFVERAWMDLFEDLPIFAGEAVDPSSYVELETEGAAAVRYFTRDPEQKYSPEGRVMLVLDVGGGTTDIALWADRELRWRDSFRIGGENFFTRFLANNIEILKRVELDEIAAFIDDQYGEDREAAASFVELLVNAPNFATGFDRSFPAFSAEAEGLALCQCAITALGGLMHYMGLVVGELSRSRKIDSADLGELTIAFGGRGSALFRQLNRGVDGDTALSRACNLLLDSAKYSGERAQVSILFSDRPKHEVARGLLIPSQTGRGRRQGLWRALPIGEAVSVSRDGVRLDLAAERDVSELMEAYDQVSLELDATKAFLESLDRRCGLAIDLNGGRGQGARAVRQKATAGLREALLALPPMDQRKPDTQSLEPPFITVLRSLVEIMAMPVGERNKRLGIKETIS
jgi:hypothetical protein